MGSINKNHCLSSITKVIYYHQKCKLHSDFSIKTVIYINLQNVVALQGILIALTECDIILRLFLKKHTTVYYPTLQTLTSWC